MNTEEIKHVRDLVLADMLNGNDETINGSILRKLDKQLTIPVVSNCLHEDNFPINRFGDSQCTDCGKVISHLDM